MLIAVIEQQSNTDIQMPFIPKTSKEAGLMAVPILVSALAFGFREVVVARLKARAEKQAVEIEMQKAEQKEKSDRIEYLEKQNQMLLSEILDLRRMMQMSGPLSLSMYDPAQK
jgi:hypothetical protein